MTKCKHCVDIADLGIDYPEDPWYGGIRYCEECEEKTVLVAIVKDYYRCTSCGADTLQHINGRIRYLQLNDLDKKKLLEMKNG